MMNLVRTLSPLPELKTDSDNILQLCLETIKESCSVLIFCPTKNWCENLAQQIATGFYKIGSSKSTWGDLLRTQLDTSLIMELLEQLKYCPVGLDVILQKTVSFGVAFHHAGLTMEERDIIEGAFRNSVLRVLVATSTLSSGVNLPARRVIIRTPMFHGKPLDSLIYRQMIGRAGRMGKDSVGESFLICQKNDYKIAKDLMSADLSPVRSCLESAGKLKRAILEVIASGVASTPEDIQLFTESTLLAVEDEGTQELSNPIDQAVEFLQMNEFIRLQQEEDGRQKYAASSLGKACLSSSMAPDDGLSLFMELEKARQCIVLETELHLIYLVTPYSACYSWENIDWMLYLTIWEKLPANMKKVGELVGIRESYIVNATRGKIVTNTGKLYHQFLVHKRFFVALALQDLVNEKPLSWVCQKFNCNRGMLQSLQQSSSSFAGMVTSFSKQLGWNSIELLLAQFQERMQFGVSRDLIDLMHLPVLNGKMARALYNAGIESVIQLANSEISAIENILHRVAPFESEKEREGESEYEKRQRNKYKNVWIAGREGLTERQAAEIFVRDARKYLKIELGLVDAQWENIKEEEEEVEENNQSADCTEVKEEVIMDYETNTAQTEEIRQNSDIIRGEGDNQGEDESVFSDDILSDTLSISDESSISNADSTIIEDIEENKECLEENIDFIKETSNRLSEKFQNISLNSPKRTFEKKFSKNKDRDNDRGKNFNSRTDLNEKSFKNEEIVVNRKEVENLRENNEAEATCKVEGETKTKLHSAAKPRSKVKTETNVEMEIETATTTKLPSAISTDTVHTDKKNSPGIEFSTPFTHKPQALVTNAHNTEVDCFLQEISLSDFSETLSENSSGTHGSKTSISASDVTNVILERPASDDMNLPASDINDVILETPVSDDMSLSSSSGMHDLSVSLKKNQSDQSLFDDESFTLQLSEQDLSEDEPLDKSSKSDPKQTNSLQQDECAYQNGLGEVLESDDEDIFGKSIEEEILLSAKRKHDSGEYGRGSKKLKTKSVNILRKNTVRDKDTKPSYVTHELRKEDTADRSKLKILDVCQELTGLENFIAELKEKDCFSFSIACSRMTENKPVIGMNVMKPEGSVDQKPAFFSGSRKLEGFSFCWDDITHYLSLENIKLHSKIIKLLKQIFDKTSTTVCMVDSKEQIKLLKKSCGVNFGCQVEDPKIADWILDPEGREKSLKALTTKYCPEMVELLHLSKGCKGVGSIGLDLYSSVPAKDRSSLESIITWNVNITLKNDLLIDNLKYLDAYDLETNIIPCLAKIELDGMRVNKNALMSLLNSIKGQISDTEKKAYALAGRKFNFNSSADVAKVLGMFRGKKTSTRKQVLEKNQHPISDLVLQWRKLHSVLTKTIYPLIPVVQNDRIHGRYITHTATGRITMHEPNLQNIPKDFQMVNPLTKENVDISCRKAFDASVDYMLLSADYCQLELRLLTHFSQDQLLCKIMREPGDVFRTVAAKWNRITEEEVTESTRQHAKHICYGIIYGMGNRTLAEQLNMDEDDAAEFMETFRNTYPGIKTFIHNTIENCKATGYVETINGRRRFLPNINESNSTKRGHAERQAVNTTIQGSAADIVKKAMIKIEHDLQQMFHKAKNKPKMVLHLHDELIYEVPTKYLRKVAKVVKKNMENSVELSVPFPVKLKSGLCWGDMSEIVL
uniref:DNA polymerase theta n=1 Tax=Diabrotica virgifera virgifera TaxID=50390 RepID=A0A6P7GLT1_DIAVI